MNLYIKKDIELKVGDTFNYTELEYSILSVEHINRMTKVSLSEFGVDTVEDAKELEKTNRLENLTVEVNGKVFSANDASQSRMDRALRMAETLGLAETQWKLAEEYNGSKVAIVTVTELNEAMAKGMYLIGKEVLGA